MMCQRYWGFQSTKACCDDNFAPGESLPRPFAPSPLSLHLRSPPQTAAPLVCHRARTHPRVRAEEEPRIFAVSPNG